MSRRLILVGVIVFVSLGAGIHWLRGHVTLAWNETESLPQSLFLVWKGELPKRRDYLLFEPPVGVGSPYPFIKRVGGIDGDIITVQGRLVTVAGVEVGLAKAASRKGHPLKIIAPGQIPPGHFYVHTDHRDSYDSRFQSIGLVPDIRVIGRAIALF